MTPRTQRFGHRDAEFSISNLSKKKNYKYNIVPSFLISEDFPLAWAVIDSFYSLHLQNTWEINSRYKLALKTNGENYTGYNESEFEIACYYAVGNFSNYSDLYDIRRIVHPNLHKFKNWVVVPLLLSRLQSWRKLCFLALINVKNFWVYGDLGTYFALK